MLWPLRSSGLDMRSIAGGTIAAGTTDSKSAGCPSELLTRFSQRSQQRDEAIRAFVEKTGRQPTDNEVAVLVRETRADKLIEISTEEVRATAAEPALAPRKVGKLTESETRRRSNGTDPGERRNVPAACTGPRL